MRATLTVYDEGGMLPIGTPVTRANGTRFVVSTPDNVIETGTVVSPGLGTDRLTILADNATFATLHYQRRAATETSVVVTVNGASQTLALDATGAVLFEVTAAAAGPVEVQAGTDPLDAITLTAS